MAPEVKAEEKIPRSECPHREQLDESLTSEGTECEVCGETEHLRLCLTCGTVTCCESREGHDRDHYEETGHPFIRPHEESYDFLWCYECGAYLTEGAPA